MTERAKQIEAVAVCIKAYESAGGEISNLRHKCIMEILDALAPWLTQWLDGPLLSQRVDRLERVTGSAQSQHEHGLRLDEIERRLTIISEAERLAAQPKTPPKGNYSVSIMRAAGSKWHAVSSDVDWVEAIECADRWYGDPEIQQVRVLNDDAGTEEGLVYLKRKA